MTRIQFRRLDGILLLDKPTGMSSNAALQVARRLFRAEKGGHTGSLDPLATGLLPLCFGEATKIAGLLLGSAKAYDAEIVLGQTTDTDDAEGQVLLERPVPVISPEALRAAIAPLLGEILQRAPIYSALKQGGEPLYVKARRGDAIEAPERQVMVHAIEILQQQPERLRLRVTCGSGTYIRSLARDLGETLGCGAHISALRRLWVEPFREPAMVTLEQLRDLVDAQDEAAMDALLLPLAAGLSEYPGSTWTPGRPSASAWASASATSPGRAAWWRCLALDRWCRAWARSTTAVCWPRSAASTSERGGPVQPRTLFQKPLAVTIPRPFYGSLPQAGFIHLLVHGEPGGARKRVPAGHASQRKKTCRSTPRRSLKTTSAARLTPALRKSRLHC